MVFSRVIILSCAFCAFALGELCPFAVGELPFALSELHFAQDALSILL